MALATTYDPLICVTREFQAFEHSRVGQSAILNIDKELANATLLRITQLEGSLFTQQSVELLNWEDSLLICSTKATGK